MPSTLFRRATAPLLTWQDVGGSLESSPDPRYVVVSAPLGDGSLVIHGQPGAPIPADAIATVFDGTAAWTWLAYGVGPSALTARTFCTPHEWAGEPSALGVTPTQYPKLASVAVLA